MRFFASVVGAAAGQIGGFYAGYYAACLWLMPASNVCGLLGLFVTGPLGLIAGGVRGWRPPGPGPR